MATADCRGDLSRLLYPGVVVACVVDLAPLGTSVPVPLSLFGTTMLDHPRRPHSHAVVGAINASEEYYKHMSVSYE